MNDIINLFKQAREVSLGADKSGKNGGNGSTGKIIVELGEDLTTLASIKVLVKSLEGLAKTYDDKVKARMGEEFAKQAMATGKRPQNFKGISTKAEASCELRKRSSSNYLNDEEVALLTAMDIPIAEEVLEEPVPERYFFNPEIAADEELAQKISECIAGIPELAGMDVLIKQKAREADVRKYLPDNALDAVAATRDAEIIKTLLPMVSSLAIRVKLVSSELGDALAVLKTAELYL